MHYHPTLTRVVSLASLVWLLAAPVGCTVTEPERPAARTASLASSGSLASAARGVRSISLHPTARIVRPVAGRSVQSLRVAIEDSILNTARERGYAIAAPGQGDLVLAYAIGVGGQLDDEELNRIFGITPGLNRAGSDGSVRGAIVLAAVNPRTGLVQWRSGASADAQPERSASQRDQAIEGVVQRMLAELPPRGS